MAQSSSDITVGPKAYNLLNYFKYIHLKVNEDVKS
jgi:hypothetical protein